MCVCLVCVWVVKYLLTLVKTVATGLISDGTPTAQFSLMHIAHKNGKRFLKAPRSDLIGSIWLAGFTRFPRVEARGFLSVRWKPSCDGGLLMSTSEEQVVAVAKVSSKFASANLWKVFKGSFESMSTVYTAINNSYRKITLVSCNF